MPDLTGLSITYCLMPRRFLVRVEAELMTGAVVVPKEREHSVKHGIHFVNLVRHVHGFIFLND